MYACTGQVPAVPNDGDPSTAQGGGGGGDLPAGLDPRTDDQLVCDKPSVAVTPLRRLTNAEYDNTVADLFAGFAVGKPSQELRFPADAFKGNFSNDASKQEIVSALAESYFDAAQKIGAAVAVSPEKLMGCDPAKAQGEDACVVSFVESFGKRAFRRSLEQTERERFMAFYKGQRIADAPSVAIGSLVQRFLMSPQFLYRIESGTASSKERTQKLNSWQMASRLSYLLAATMPDAELLAAAESDHLSTADDVADQAERLMRTDRARAVRERSVC